MKAKLEFLIQKILPNYIEQIKITEESVNNYVTYNIEAPEDIKPILIGRNGKTIKALYNLLYPVAKRENIHNFQLKIKD